MSKDQDGSSQLNSTLPAAEYLPIHFLLSRELSRRAQRAPRASAQVWMTSSSSHDPLLALSCRFDLAMLRKPTGKRSASLDLVGISSCDQEDAVCIGIWGLGLFAFSDNLKRKAWIFVKHPAWSVQLSTNKAQLEQIVLEDCESLILKEYAT